ncbi:hypothetical protein GCM10007417_26830 [Glycocaulis alkaliphilus]|nr:hypothetical protein GCM10007417_26830 [Glycocaulis alkaliphilus]
MAAGRKAEHAGPDILALTAKAGHEHQPVENVIEAVEIAFALRLSPFLRRLTANLQQVFPRFGRKTPPSHYALRASGT